MEKLYSINIRYIYETVKNEGWPFIFICTYLFFEYVRPQSIYTWIDVIPWCQIILILTIISLFFEKDRYSTDTILNKLMIVYAVVVLLSSLMSTYPDESFSKLRTFFDWFIIYFLIVKIVNNEKRFFIFFLSFLIYSFKMSQHGARSWIMRGFAFADWGVTGAPGWFHNSGEFGIQMCIFVPLSVAFIFAVEPYISKKWLVVLLLMPFSGILSVVASSSRGALFGLVASALWFAGSRIKKILYVMPLVLIIGFAVYQSIPYESMCRFENMGNDRTSKHRIERWQDAIETLKENPFIGIGFEAWVEYYHSYDVEITGTPLVHNIFFQCGSELGLAGLTVLVSMIVFCFKITRNIRKITRGCSDRFLSIMSRGMDCALVGFIVSASFVTVLYYPFFWIHIALTASIYISAKRKILIV